MSKVILIILSALFLLNCSETTKPVSKKASAPPVVSTPPAPVHAGVGTGRHTTASGLQYEVLKRGAGTVSPTAADNVTVHYHGTLLDGTVFDSSVQRGQPASFPLSGVIPGWTEGLQLMKTGDKFKFVIPSHLAYGGDSPSPSIPPFSTLVFEVELLAVNGMTL